MSPVRYRTHTKLLGLMFKTDLSLRDDVIPLERKTVLDSQFNSFTLYVQKITFQ